MLGTDELRLLSHGQPDAKRDIVHVKQSQSLPTFAALAVDADRGKKSFLTGFG